MSLKRFVPNYKMIVCGIFNGDEFTYLYKMCRLIDSFTGDTFECVHKYLDSAELDVETVELYRIIFSDAVFNAGRCLTCGRVYYSILKERDQ